MYKPAGTIATALNSVQNNEFVLPAIQREFVWKPHQIERLFDSLMQGYPFGTFLYWKIRPETSAKFKFYDFVVNYHERDAAHCPELPTLHDRELTAVLDGQQRLTALNIGLRGWMSMKLPNKWWSSPEAFPKKVLHLKLSSLEAPDEDGVIYSFRFMSDADIKRAEGELWFPVPKIMGMKGGPAMFAFLTGKGLSETAMASAFEILDRLHRMVHADPLISYFEETTQDVERVLNIFIRLNSGGTVLSYSDLLLSVAVAQWDKIDARAEIHGLVDEVNGIGGGFNFTKDFALKAGLMLADIASVGFKVENFTHENMQKLESKWADIKTAIVRTAELAASFGLSGQSLRADSALLPIAYYLYRRGAPENYILHSSYAADRQKIRMWLISSLLKASGIWGSGLDTLLTALRDIIRNRAADGFPDTELRREMDTRGKSLSFSAAEIDDLLKMPYGDKRTFGLLSLLFTFVDVRNHHHIDHVFPISRFTPTRLRKIGIEEHQIGALIAVANDLPNLQLLEGLINNEKRAALPLAWLQDRFGKRQDREHYLSVHDLSGLPADIDGCLDFWAARRERLRERVTTLLA